MSSGVSERALERMSATERASEASSASSAKERANSAVKQVAQHSKKVTRRFHDHSSQCAATWPINQLLYFFSMRLLYEAFSSGFSLL